MIPGWETEISHATEQLSLHAARKNQGSLSLRRKKKRMFVKKILQDLVIDWT